MGKGDRDWRVVLVQCGNEPVVHPRHRDLARVQFVNDLSAGLAAVVNLKRITVGFVFYDDPGTAIM
jgi:cellulase/cellobiase CelA1